MNTTTKNISKNKGKPLKHLEKFYHTLDKNIPLDRALLNAGYRSLNQFGKSIGVQPTVFCCWRKGKACGFCGSKNVIDEMITKTEGFSLPMRLLMEATGCTESELFPEIFTEEFYKQTFCVPRIKSPAHTFVNEPVENNERRRVIHAVISTLPERNRLVIEAYFGIGDDHRELTLEEIGIRCNVTRERIRQIICQTIRQLRSLDNLRKLHTVIPFECSEDRLVSAHRSGDCFRATDKTCGFKGRK